MNNTKILALRSGAATLLVVLVVAPPLGIAALIGRPYPEWTTLSNEIDAGQVSVDTVMRVAAALFIGIWIWLVISIGCEIFRIINARRGTTTASAPRPLREPVGTNHLLQRLVRFALLGTVTTAATVSTWSSAVVATSPTLASLTRTDPPATAPIDPADAGPATPATTTIVADGRLTPLAVAVDLGDENLRDDIVAMNRWAEWTNGVFPAGMLITIPVLETTTDAEPAGAPGSVDRYVVQENDGMWNVAEAFLGDGSRHHELHNQLVGQHVAPGIVFSADTHVIHPGWVFTNPNGTAPTEAPATVTVRSGDTLSELAAQHLGDADRWPEIWNLNANVRMPDGRVFDDPDLILPGWELALTETPLVEAPPPSPAIEDQPIADPPVETSEPSAPVIPRTSAEPAGALPDVDQPPATTAQPSTTAPTTLPPPTVEPAAATAPDADVDAAAFVSTADRSVWPHLTVGALLVAGLAATIRRLRNRRLSRLTPGHRLTRPPAVAAGTEHAIRSIDTTPVRTTIHGLLRSLTPYAAEQPEPPAVRAVQIGTERVEVLFSKPAPMPPTGWSTIDGGHSWTHRLEDPTFESRQLLTPALVTIGARADGDSDEVLLDLETAGSLAITGDRDASLGLARSIALELATYPLGVSMDVCLVGLSVDGTELCDRVWNDTTMTRAVRVAQQRLDRGAAEDGADIVAARAQLTEDDGAHDPQVFVVDLAALTKDDRLLVDDLVRLCQPSTGTVVAIVGDHADANERLAVEPDGTARWSGVDLRAPNVTRQAAGEVAVMLDHVANAESEPIEPDHLVVADLRVVDDALEAADQRMDSDEQRAEPDVDDLDAVEPYVYAPPPHDVVVQVMGNVHTHGADLTADETELLALLTCLRDQTEIHIGLVHEAVAPERSKKTVGNRISRLRGRLGAGSDGRDLLPEASSGRNGRSHYLVSPLVVTDVDLLEHRLHTAETLSSTDALDVMRDGLELMEGPLFRARKGFDAWPQSEGVVVAMTAVIQSYATRLIELAVDVDDIALVIRTTATAGRVLDNPLSEFPMRQAEQAYAEACGDTDLLASVEGARQRLIDYIDADDAFADAQ